MRNDAGRRLRAAEGADFRVPETELPPSPHLPPASGSRKPRGDEFRSSGRSYQRPTPEGSKQMQIRARMSMSADGYVTTPDGWPAQLADPAFVSGESHGIREFLEGCEAALMGRTTFEPALANPRWPWPNLNVFVLASHRPAGTPDEVVTESDPARAPREDPGRQPERRRPPRRGASHDRDLPRPRSARQAPPRRAAVAARRRAAADPIAQLRHETDVRA
jgi:hypothetical protein